MIRSRRAVVVGGGIRLLIDVWEPYREKYYAIFVNGVWTGINAYAPVVGLIKVQLPTSPGAAINSIYVDEVYEWDDFPNTIPNGWAEVEDAQSANRIRKEWKATYSQSSVTGDSQITSISISGAKRGRNVSPLPEWRQRGRLYYSITNLSGTYVVRWWAGELLVAEGTRVGNGALTCTAMNSSGVEITCTLTYTAEVKAGAAFLELKWPEQFQIHYSQSALAFPRTPEETRFDNGTDAYVHRTPELAPGTWHYNVLQVGDNGVETYPVTAPADSPLTIKSPPLPVTGLVITGSATGGLTAMWVVGEAGCTFEVFRSDVNDPINFGTRASPGPYGPTAVDAGMQYIDTVSGYAPVDRSSDWAAVVSDFDTAASDGNTLFASAGSSVFTAVEATILAALTTFGTALGGIRFRAAKRQVTRLFSQIQGAIESLPVGFTTAEWQDRVGPFWGQALLFLGALLEGNSGRYAQFANGAVPGGASPSGSTPTGSAPDGTAARVGVSFSDSLYTAVQPMVRNGKLRVVVRASKSGVTEKNDTEVEIEFDASGNIVDPRPNKAHIQSITVASGLTNTFKIGVIEDDGAAVATNVDLYVVAVGTPIDVTTPSASGTLPAAVGGYHEITVQYTVGAPGHYQIAAVARSAAGVRSEEYEVQTRYIAADVPGSVSNLSAKVVRGVGVRGEEIE